jgi:hypothetical protein
MASSPDTPATPDPAYVAGTQSKYNSLAARETAALNRPNQYTPLGNQIWKAPDTARADSWEATEFDKWKAAQANNPTYQAYNEQDRATNEQQARDSLRETNPFAGDRSNWSSHIELDPRVQKVLDSQLATSEGLTNTTNKALENVNNTLGQPINYAGLPGHANASASRDAAALNFTDPSGDLAAQQGVTATARDVQGTALQRMLGTIGQDFNYNGAPALPQGDDATRQRVEDAMYGRATSRLDPKFSQSENALRTNLMNRGLTEGSQAWKTAMENFGRERTDAYGAAQNDAITRGGEEMQRLHSMGLASRQQSVGESNYMRELASKEAAAASAIGGAANADLRGLYGVEASQQGAIDASSRAQYDMQNSDRDRQLAEEERKRALVLNELSALRGGSQVQMPNFGSGQSGASVGAAPYAQSAYNSYQGQMGQYNADVGSANQTNTAVAGAAATAAGAYMSSAGGAALLAMF